MGQNGSNQHKHARNEIVKSTTLAHPNVHQVNVNSQGTGPGGISAVHSAGNYDYSFSHEDDEETSYPPILPTKNSVSSSEMDSSSKTSARSDQISINNSPAVNRLNEPLQQQQPKQPKTIPVVFRYSLSSHNKNVKEVLLIGTFTGWRDKIPMIKSDGDYVVVIDLPEGQHQYKFVVDGRWEHDPKQSTVDDNFNGKNNYVVVNKSDFEVMDALESDSASQQQKQINTDDLSRSPPGEYTDETPVFGVNNI